MHVQEVDLRGNGIADNGAMILARAMRAMQNNGLRRLDLSYNEIGDDGAFTLANVRRILRVSPAAAGLASFFWSAGPYRAASESQIHERS